MVIISGPSGVGKSEIAQRLLAIKGLKISENMSFTTRSPRQNEINGQHYNFISKNQFETKIKANEFLEFIKYNGDYYGTDTNSFKKLLLCQNVLLVIDYRGFQKIKRIWGSEYPIVAFFLRPPTWEKLIANLKKRGANNELEIKNRVKIAQKELAFSNEYDYILEVNDNFAEVVKEISEKIAIGKEI